MCAVSCFDLDLTFDLAVVTFIYHPGYISETVRFRKLILNRDIS